MNESLGAGSGPDSQRESDDSTGEKVFEYATEYGPTDFDELREFASSGALTGLGGAVTVVRGLGSLRRGETGRGLVRLATGVLLLALAVAQRRTRGDESGGRDAGAFDQTDVASSDPDLEDVSSGLDTANESPETDVDPAEAVGTSSDLEDVSSGLDDEDRGGSVGDVDQTDVADTGPDIEGVDPDPDPDPGPGSTSQERAGRSDASEMDAGTTLDEGTTFGEETEGAGGGFDADTEGNTTDEEAGVSTESGEVGVEEETSDEVDADTDAEEDEGEKSG